MPLGKGRSRGNVLDEIGQLRSRMQALSVNHEVLDMEIEMDESVNVLGEPLQECSGRPLTGFFRDGLCNTCEEDVGSHTVCIEASDEFLQYSRFKGNDLSTPIPEYGFEGVKAGDGWCLCAARWLEAHEDNMAPRVFLMRTHRRALEVVPFELLKQFAVDLN